MNVKRIFTLLLLLAALPLLQAQTDQPIIPNRKIAGQKTIPALPTGAVKRAGVSRPNGPGAPTLPQSSSPPLSAVPGTPAVTPDAGQPGGAANPGATNGAAGGGKAEVANINYNFPAMPIGQVLEEYGKLVGKTLLVAQSGQGAIAPTTLISLTTQSPLTHDEAVTILETVLGMNGVTIVNISDKIAKVEPEGMAGSAGGIPSTNSASHLPDSGKYITQIVQLHYAKPEELTAVLGLFAKMPNSIIVVPSTQTLILRDYAENVKRMLEMVEKIDVAVTNEIKHEVIPIKYALASDISSALSSLGGGTTVSVGKSSGGAGFSPRSGGVGSGMNGGMGGAGYNQNGGSIAPGQPSGSSNPLNTPATGARSTFQKNLQNLVNKAGGGGAAGDIQLFGVTKIIADERTNSLLIFANDEDMKTIKDIINQLDVVLAQVLIEAIILEVSLTDSKDTGVSYLQNQSRIPGTSLFGGGGLNNLSSAASGFLSGTSSTTPSVDPTTGLTNTTSSTPSSFSGANLAGLPGGFSYFASLNKDLNVVLTAVAGAGRVNVLSRPRIQTSHAVPANLFIGQTVPYVTGTYFGGGFSGGPSSQYQEKEVGITLQVLPLINTEGLVVMDIEQDIEQLGPPVAIPGAGNVPTTTKRQASAKVAVQDGETIILGGFISASRSKSHSGIPILKDIPGLGVLFRSTSEANERTELIVLMRPTVLKTPEIAAIVAREERNKMSGIKQAERDLREDERKRNEQIEKELEKDEARKKAEDEKKAKKELKRLEKINGKAPAPVVAPTVTTPTTNQVQHLNDVLAEPDK